MPFNEFQWRSMTAAIEKLPKKNRLLQELVFKDGDTHSSNAIDVDITIGGNTILPFVSPISGGTIVGKMGREVNTVQAPRVRPKKPFSAPELLDERAAGAVFYPGSGGSIQQARRKKLGEELTDLDTRIGDTKEWMCAQALKGSLNVVQSDLSFNIDYQIPDAHKPDLSASAALKWNGTAPDIMGDLETWCDLPINAGHAPRIAIMGKDAWAAMRVDDEVKEHLDNRRIDAGELKFDATVAYKGHLNGLDLYRYGGVYTPWGGGASQQLIPDNAFIIVDPSAKFRIEYGAITDLDAEAKVVGKYFAKSWTEKDPSALWLLAESHPLPVPWQPEAIIYATVTG